MDTQELKFLKGEALCTRLKELQRTANQHHHEVRKCWRGVLNAARLSGEALREAKKRLGGRGKWTDWRRRCFEGSLSTARVYVRVAERWNDPRAVEARATGLEITSIAAFLELVKDSRRPKGTKPEVKQTEDEWRRDWTCAMLRAEFSKKLYSLDDEELNTMSSAGIAPFWNSILQLIAELSSSEAKERAAAEEAEEAERRAAETKERKLKRRQSQKRQRSPYRTAR